ncbi:MAG: phosphodiester glycosidase family protein [Bacteroidales bacterium]|nr:phosphodiester glycosidase family protein [Bacteroidales bacterium]
MKRNQFITLFLLFAGFCNATANPTPADKGWTVETIAEGINYYTYSGIEEISGAAQQIFVIEQDLSNPRYALRFVYYPERIPTSEAFWRNDAVVAMNAGYEAQSIVIKVNERLYSCMPYNNIINTPVPNWKSEGAVYTDGKQGVRISFDGKDMSIAEQREFYANSTEPNILTSAPMLVDDFDPVGTRFVDPSLSLEELEKLDYEDPIRHQGVRHPRTAVAKTADNHLILIAVDGRRDGIGEGMSAREFTEFIVKWFNPQYALNMDGGGSTTLCVRGQGDPETHVVNYPTNNHKYDHDGQRKRDSLFLIVEVPEEEDQPSNVREGVHEEVLADHSKASGLDNTYDLGPKASTPAPKGYEPVYVSHYGRHGSRYAYTSDAYTVPLEMLRKGADNGNLTEYGKKLLGQLSDFWERNQYKVGDLTPLGWEQHRQIAKTMVSSFPTAFGKGSSVDACSSASSRSMMSMGSFCVSIAKESPATSVYEHQGMMDIQAARPNMGKNPFRYKGPHTYLPYAEDSEGFFFRKMPDYQTILARMFKDPSVAVAKKDAYDTFFNLYMLVGGMASIPEEERLDVDGIFTAEEYVRLWEVDNYERFQEYINYRTSCSSIVDDIIAKADARLAGNSRGADLRFGHDHVVMALLMIMDIDGFGFVPDSVDDIVNTFQTFRSPMAANMQFVFYTPKKGKKGDVLVKLLLNGEEASLGALAPVDGPYYEWSAVKDYLNSRTALFVRR